MFKRVVLLLVAIFPALLFEAPAPAAAQGSFGFSAPVFVDRERAGGEPVMVASSKHGTLVYSSHEGDTHIYRDGVVSGGGDLQAAENARNQVYVWTSSDGGATWQRTDFNGTGFTSNPATNTGFSDPDLTEDESGLIYDTGIDLANDALFSSPDGGRSFPTGTVQCHDGDRPWLAGGVGGEVFLATDPGEGQHSVFRSADAGASCSLTGIQDAGTTDAGQPYTGFGKLYYDHNTGPRHGALFEPVIYNAPGHAGETVTGVGVSVLPPGGNAFTQHKVADTSLFAHWPAIAIDRGDNVYLVWDTDARRAETNQGCAGAQDPAPNAVKMSVSRDGGVTWQAPVEIAKPQPNTRYMWPWVVAGDAGKVDVSWYQTDQLVDPDCQASNISIYAAQVFNATDLANRSQTTANVAGRVIHYGGVCQGGTTCVATGQDRRLGDFFTNAIDQRGCVLVASGDTTLRDSQGAELPLSRPIFMRQNSGLGLLGQDCGPQQANAAATATTAPTAAAGLTPFSRGPGSVLPVLPLGLSLAGVLALLLAGAVLEGRRRRRR